MDICGPYGSDLSDPKEEINISTLATNCSATHQPMEMGIISTWKQLYRSTLLRTILINMETWSERKEANKGLKEAIIVMHEGFDPHLQDVANMVKERWDNLSDRTISRCWVRAKILPVPMDADIAETFGRMRNHENDDTVKEMMAYFKKLSITVGPSDTFCEQVENPISEEDISKCVEIEDSEQVQEALVTEALDQIDYETTQRVSDVAVEPKREYANGEEENPLPLTSLMDTGNAFP